MKPLFVRRSRMFFKSIVDPWILVAAGVLISALWVGHKMAVSSAVEKAVHATKTEMVREYQKKLDISVLEAISKSKTLQASADKIKEEKYEKLKSINSVLVSDLVSLQQRSKRSSSPSSTTNSADSSASCTAAQLYREDAEFLTREAARADEVILERDYYYNRYLLIEEGLNGKR